MSKQNTCANSKTNNCQGVVTQKGNILCNACIEARKTLSKNRRDQDLDNFVEKNKIMEQELSRLRIDVLKFSTENNEYKNKVSGYETELKDLREKYSSVKSDSKHKDYSDQLQKENIRLSDIISKFRENNEKLVKEKGMYEMTYNQTKLDYQKLLVENERYRTLNKQLMEQNDMLEKENARFHELLESGKGQAEIKPEVKPEVKPEPTPVKPELVKVPSKIKSPPPPVNKGKITKKK
jgi:chromosome segregation ATPase